MSSFSLSTVKASAAYNIQDLGTWAPVGYNYTTSGGFVKAAQANLWSAGEKLVVGSIDGSFGPATYQAVKNFQSKNGLSVDGNIGPGTWGLMEDYTIILDSRSRKFVHPNSPTYFTRFAQYAVGGGTVDNHWDLGYKSSGDYAGQGGTIWTDY